MAEIIDINAVRAMRLAAQAVDVQQEFHRKRWRRWCACEVCEGMGLLRIQHDPIYLHAARLVPVAFGQHRDSDMVCQACAGQGVVWRVEA